MTIRFNREKRFFRDAQLMPQCSITPPKKDDPATRELAEEMERNPPDIPFFRLSAEEKGRVISVCMETMRNELGLRLRGLDT